uniref:Uncharacterized protein n=1 Tax=Sphaerodactylus townsendi TaxID=933632 RepID=A0ACB8EFT4_9SAUR
MEEQGRTWRKELLSSTVEQQVKPEPVEGLQQDWESQWQEFLKTMQASDSQWKNPPTPQLQSAEDSENIQVSVTEAAHACPWPRIPELLERVGVDSCKSEEDLSDSRKIDFSLELKQENDDKTNFPLDLKRHVPRILRRKKSMDISRDQNITKKIFQKRQRSKPLSVRKLMET